MHTFDLKISQMQLDRLYTFQANLLKSVSRDFTRFLFSQITWKQRMLGILRITPGFMIIHYLIWPTV
jgi:hypothetical protein